MLFHSSFGDKIDYELVIKLQQNYVIIYKDPLQVSVFLMQHLNREIPFQTYSIRIEEPNVKVEMLSRMKYFFLS
jgi:hypothetical protein